MTSWVCVDSNVALNLYLSQPLRPKAKARWQTWVEVGMRFAAPPLFRYEATATCRKTVYQGILRAEQAADVLREVLALPLDYLAPPDLHQRAYALATQLGRPTAYDAHYLVVAQVLNCEFWTADQRLVNAARDTFPWIKWLGDYEPEE